MLDSRAWKVLHAFWQEANKLRTRAEEEAIRYRNSAARIIKKAEEKGNFLKNASFWMVETAEIQARRIKDDAVCRYNAEEKVREIRIRIEEVKRMRQEEKKKEIEKEKREEKEGRKTG